MRVDWSQLVHLLLQVNPKSVLLMFCIAAPIISLSSLVTSVVVIQLTFESFFAIVPFLFRPNQEYFSSIFILIGSLMYFRSSPEEETHRDNSIIVVPSCEIPSSSTSREFHRYTAQFLLISGLLGFFISYPFTFLPNFLGILLHFFIVIIVCASLNFLIVFGISDFCNFVIFSILGFRSPGDSAQTHSANKPLIETTEQVPIIRFWRSCSFLWWTGHFRACMSLASRWLITSGNSRKLICTRMSSRVILGSWWFFGFECNL